MSSRLVTLLVEQMKSDSELLHFLKESEYGHEECKQAIPRLTDEESFYFLMEYFYYISQDKFRMVLECFLELKHLSKIPHIASISRETESLVLDELNQ